MVGMDSPLVLWCSLGLLLVGMFGLVAARVCARIPRPSLWPAVFFAALAVVGLGTAVLLCLSSSYWLLCGATLSLMVVGATLDLDGSANLVDAPARS